ncbi:MAG TPA: glycosyltransferase [Ilumatobacteraceae bacterium]|nr:glycosyltransferase [Ilumatobacteraceae bacterium]
MPVTSQLPVTPQFDDYAAEMIRLGARRVHVLAWRDLDDIDAGGSELHAHEFMRRFAAAGLNVTQRTSAAAGLSATDRRDGYDVVRRGSRYSVFPRAIASELTGRMGRFDALIEVWNGVPWLTPLWCRKPRIMFLHHVHGPMWDQILPKPLAAAGRLMETRLAPPLYRRTATLTPSDATRDELIALGFKPDRAQRCRPVLPSRRRAVAGAADRRRGSSRAGEAVRRTVQGRAGGQDPRARPATGHRR